MLAEAVLGVGGGGVGVESEVSMGSGSAAFTATTAIFFSRLGGGIHVTGSLITPHVRRIGPEAPRGLLLRGLKSAIPYLPASIALLAVRSLALRCEEPPPESAPRLKSNAVRSTASPRNRAIWGFDLNFFPQGLKHREEKGEGQESSTTIRNKEVVYVIRIHVKFPLGGHEMQVAIAA